MISINEYIDTSISPPQMNLIFQSRIIWRDLVTWIRAYFISTYTESDDQEAVKQRLYKLPSEYGNVFRIIFGDQITERYSSLLFDSFETLTAYITAQKNGDTDAANYYLKLMYENADQRAAFLSQINPFWQVSEWKRLMYELIHLTTDESSAYLSKEYARSIEIFDRLLTLSSEMGDYYSEGLFNYLNYSNRQVNIL